MSTSIFFDVTRPDGNPNAEPTVVATIYSRTGRRLAKHVMTMEGAIVRMHDLDAAIAECRERRNADLLRDLTSSTGRYPDYPSVRVDSEHEEFPKNGRTWCDACGWVDELDLIKNRAAIVEWHGDSFGLF